MTDQELEQRLARAIEHTAPDDVEGVLSRCEARKGNVIPMTNPTAKHPRRALQGLIAACLALCLVGGGLAYHQAYAVSSVVSLDVNPSMELRVNRNEKVLSCTPLNQDAEEVLASMDGGDDLKGAKLDVAVNAIVGALVRCGYLDSVSSAILISVEDKNTDRAVQLQQQLSGVVNELLSSTSGASVLSQTVSYDTALAEEAQANGVSIGKAALIRQIQALNADLAFADLAALSVEELKDLRDTGAPALPIGQEAALNAALAFAGLETSDLLHWEVDAELEELPAHYEVEWKTNGGKFEYKVDAYNGTILDGIKNTSSVTSSTASSGSSGSTSSTVSSDTTAPTGQAKALAAALADAGAQQSQITALEVETEDEDGKTIYEIEFYDGSVKYEYKVDGNGQILRKESKNKSATPAAPASSTQTASDIGREKAKALAFAHAGVSAGAITELEVETDQRKGQLVYEVEFRTADAAWEYTIAASDGSILEYDIHDDHDDHSHN